MSQLAVHPRIRCNTKDAAGPSRLCFRISLDTIPPRPRRCRRADRQRRPVADGAISERQIWSVIQLAVALCSLFFFFRDRDYMLGVLRCLVPLSEHEIDEALESVRTMVRATIYGNVVTSLLPGDTRRADVLVSRPSGTSALGRGHVRLFLVPSLGSFLVWAPAAVILAITGSWGKAVIIVAWGMLVVGTIDNIVYPVLVGRDIRMHTLAVFPVVPRRPVYLRCGRNCARPRFVRGRACIDRHSAPSHSARTLRRNFHMIPSARIGTLAEAVQAGDLAQVRVLLRARPELVNMDMSGGDEHRVLPAQCSVVIEPW